MVYGYMRISTLGQLKGNSLEEQERVLRANGAMEIYQDVFTGTKTARPNFSKLLQKLTIGDTLIVTKLDRFARNTIEGLSIIQSLLEKGIRVHILNMGTVDNTPTGKLILTVMLGFAEFERDMIVQRTQEGKAIARCRDGYTEGRPKRYSDDEIENALVLLRDYSYRTVAAMTSISKSTLQREMKNRQITIDTLRAGQ